MFKHSILVTVFVEAGSTHLLNPGGGQEADNCQE